MSSSTMIVEVETEERDVAGDEREMGDWREEEVAKG